MDPASLKVTRAFRWAANTLRIVLQVCGLSTVQDSLLTQSAGSDSDFSGGAAGWEVAADMISAACSSTHGLSGADLSLCSVCAARFRHVAFSGLA